METIKIALEECKKFIDYLIDCDDDFNDEEIESAIRFIKGLGVGCECDDYNGFDCGCSHRNALIIDALDELNKLRS
jgi:hypothetical protein